MSLFSKIAVGLGAFLIVTGIIYGISTYEWEGFALLITVAGGALVVGVYLVSAVHRTRAVLDGRRTTAELAGVADEPHIAPTIWPLVFALSTIGLVVGAVAARWALVGGGVLFIVASIGWIVDIRRQWRPHAHTPPHEVTRNHSHGRQPS